jgi:hypothetical protein
MLFTLFSDGESIGSFINNIMVIVSQLTSCGDVTFSEQVFT